MPPQGLPNSRPRQDRAVSMSALASMFGNIVRSRLQGEEALLNPLFVSWEINSACNLRCPYCYLHQRSYGFMDKGLSFAEIKRVLGRIKAVTQDVLLLGGEPFIHPAWDDMVDYCADTLGLRVRCITNGTRLEAHMRTTGRLHLLVVSYDHKRVKVYPDIMADMRRQLALVNQTHPHLQVLINFVLCSDDDPLWVVDQIDEFIAGEYNIFVNVDRYFGEGRVDSRIVAGLKRQKIGTRAIHMTDTTLDWLEDTGKPVPFCKPTLLPLLDPQARLIYPCCYFDEQTAGSLLDWDYHALLRESARRFGHYPFSQCATCSTTAYLDASVAVKMPWEGLRHYHLLYN